MLEKMEDFDMTLQEFQSLKADDLENLTVKELSHLVSEQGKKLNKRVKNIEKDRRSLQESVLRVKESGGSFGTHGSTNKKELINEAKREQMFSKEKTSTVKGARIAKESLTKKTGKSAREYGREQKEKYKKEHMKADMSKKEKQKVGQKARKVGEESENEYNDRINTAWDRFHKWKESHPALSYNKGKVQSQVDEYAIGDRQRMTFISTINKEEMENTPDVLSTVDMSIPFVE